LKVLKVRGGGKRRRPGNGGQEELPATRSLGPKRFLPEGGRNWKDKTGGNGRCDCRRRNEKSWSEEPITPGVRMGCRVDTGKQQQRNELDRFELVVRGEGGGGTQKAGGGDDSQVSSNLLRQKWGWATWEKMEGQKPHPRGTNKTGPSGGRTRTCSTLWLIPALRHERTGVSTRWNKSMAAKPPRCPHKGKNSGEHRLIKTFTRNRLHWGGGNES